MEAFASQRLCEEYNKEKRRVMCDRHVYTVNQAEVEVAMLLPRFLHGRYFIGDETLDDAIRVPDLVMCPVSRGNQPELIPHRGKRAFDLLQRIFF